MTRAVVFLTAALAAASLGLFAEESSKNPAVSPGTVAVPQNQAMKDSPAPQSSAPSSSNPATAASAQNAQVQKAPAPTPNNHRAVDHAGSPPNTSDDGTANGQLPQTSTILPLLGLIGLGSLVAGLFARR